MSKRSRMVVLGAVSLLALTALAFALARSQGKQPASVPMPTALVATATRSDLASTLTVAGQFQPYQEVELHAKVAGYIRHINVDIGDHVHSGEVIATLEVPELNAQVASSQATIRHSQAEIERAQNGIALAEANYAAVHAAYTRLAAVAKQRPGLIAEQELDDSLAKDLDAQAKINVAKSALDATKEQLGVSRADSQRVTAMQGYSVVTAPFNGVVTMRFADVGSLIQAGTSSNTQSMPVVKVAQNDLLRLRMPVPEKDVPYIQEGGEVQVKVQATGKSFAGKIVRFTRELDVSTRTMLAEVDVPNSDQTLSTGMFAETIIVLQQQNNVLLVPESAVMKDEGPPYVLTVDGNNKVGKVPVMLGIQGADRIAILGGLTDNQPVIVSGQANYRIGQQIQPKQATISMPVQEDNQ
jgi:RND family efflux transporter MFP subunit